MKAPAPKDGLNRNEWPKWMRNLLTTGTYDPNEWHTLNGYQKDWTKDTMNTLTFLSKKL